MDPIGHFELPYKDLKRMQDFYKKFFGWEFSTYPMKDGSEYQAAMTTEMNPETRMPAKPGMINGGLMSAEENQVPGAVLTIIVADLDKKLEELKAAGHEIIMNKVFEGAGKYARFRDPEGTVMGLWEDLGMQHSE